MTKKKAIVIVIIGFQLFISSFYLIGSGAGGEGVKKTIEGIAQAFEAGLALKISPYLIEGKRVYSDWEDVVDSKGYFGKSQLILSFQKFFKEFKVINVNVPETEIRNIDSAKTLFKMVLSYKNLLSNEVKNKNVFIMLIKNKGTKKGEKASEWAIIEIKTIQ